MEYYSPQPVQTEKKDRTLLNVLLAGCGCLLIIGLAVGIFLGKIFQFASSPKKTVESHLKAINEGKFDLAYTYFDSRYKDSTSLESFRSQLGSHSSLFPYKDLNLNRIEVNNDSAAIEGTLTARDGAIFPLHYELQKQQGEWKIRRFKWTSHEGQQEI